MSGRVPSNERINTTRFHDGCSRHWSRITLKKAFCTFSRCSRAWTASWPVRILVFIGFATSALIAVQAGYVSAVLEQASSHLNLSRRDISISAAEGNAAGRDRTRMLSSLNHGPGNIKSTSGPLLAMKLFRAPIRRGSGQALRIYTDLTTEVTGMCRIPRACLDTNGKIYIPHFLKMYKHLMYGRCRIPESSIVFYDEERDRETRSPESTSYYPNTHVLGTRPLRYHMPHLLDDFLGTVVLLSRYLQREKTTPWKSHDPTFHPPNTSVRCFDPNEPGFGDEGMPCASNPPRKIGVLVEDRAQAVKWTPGFFELLGSPNSKAPLEVLYESEIFPLERSPASDKTSNNPKGNIPRRLESGRACFGSVSVKGPLQLLSPDIIEKNVLFSHSGIQRVLPTFRSSQRCRLNITVINRPITSTVRGYPTGPRSIQNVKELVAALENEAKKRDIIPNVQVHDKFGEITFKEQFKIMQSTQILVSVHGAELTNTILLRRGVRVVEIYPFRYTPDIFANQVRTFGMFHTAYIAHPDEEGYRQCINYFNPPGSSTWSEAERAIGRFETRARTFRRASSESLQQGLGAFWDGANNVNGLRPCARSQRMVVDPNAVARHALKDCYRVCYGNMQT